MKIRNRFIIRSLAKLITLSSRVLFKTCRIQVIEQRPGVSPYVVPVDERFIYCNWHDGILGSLFCGHVQKMAALTSRHTDGDYVADIMEAVGIQPVRGSSSQGGAAAIAEMLEFAKDFHITIATDGPRGPRRLVKPGIIFLASHANRKIVPIAFAAKNAWRPKGKWTDLVVPKPFSTIYAIGGEPMTIPKGLNKQQLASYRDELQQRMDDLNAQADELAGVPSMQAWPAQSLRKAA